MVNSRDKLVVNIVYPCYICGNQYRFAKQMIDHISNVHGYILEPRPRSYGRPDEAHFKFERILNGPWDIQHYGCPSCWFHCSLDIEELMAHILGEHDPALMADFVHPVDEEDEYELVVSDGDEYVNASDEEEVEMKEEEEEEEEEFHEVEEQDAADDDISQTEIKQEILSNLDTLGGIFKKMFQ